MAPPVSTPTPLPAPTQTSIATATIAPINLSGDWYLLNGRDPILNITTIVHNGNQINGETKFKNGAVSIFKGAFDPLKMEWIGSWTYSLGGSGTFNIHVRDNRDQLAGTNNLGDRLCLARDKTTLPKFCDWK